MCATTAFGADETPAPPASMWPALERACSADIAERHEALLTIAHDQTAPPPIRALAQLGAARWANAPAESLLIWQSLADDNAAPTAYRDAARRQIMVMERTAKNLPPWDRDAHRTTLPVVPTPAVVLHVAPHGSDTAKGTNSAPLATLAGARDLIRRLRAGSGGRLPVGGVRVIVQGGTYLTHETLTLQAEDSGTEASPIIYQAAPDETPILTGGVTIPAWQPITDITAKQQLDPAVQERVLEADLAALGVRELGDPTTLRQSPELFIDGVPQTLARWPNEGFVATGEILGTDTFTVWGSIAGCRDGKFKYLEDRPSRWGDEPDVRLYGYWFWDWYEEFQQVATIDADEHVFTLAKPFSVYGYRAGQRYRAVNVLRELDLPGEWYLDRRSGKLYWLPPTGKDWEHATATVSVLSQPFIELKDTTHVLLAGLVLEDGRADGIRMHGGSECVIAACTLRRLGGDAVVVEGGYHHTIFGCTMHTLGCGAMRVAGGDRTTLVAGHHVVENCHVADIARLKRTYAPAVHLDGCGNRIAHNRFERIPSSAMRIEGNDHLIELNSIQNVVQESDDQGGVDMFGNPLYRGVVIRWNLWQDITGGTHCGAAGVRLDDMISGVTVQGNAFVNCGAVQFGGVQIHGGKENVVDNNLFLNCFAGMSFSRWGEKRWLESIAGFLKDATTPPYAERYPDLAKLSEDADINWVTRNAFVRCGSVFLRDGGIQQSALNVSAGSEFDLHCVADAASIAGIPELRNCLIEPIPIGDIGPYEHPWRAPAP